MPQKTMTGARAKVYLGGTGGSSDQQSLQPVGIFNNVSWGLQYDAQAVHILGRFSPDEIVYTGQEPIGVTATGWRVINNGPHNAGKVPKLQDLMQTDYLTFVIVDRQTGATMATIHSVRPTGYTSSLTERQLQSMTLTFMGLLVDSEEAQNVETAGAAELP